MYDLNVRCEDCGLCKTVNKQCVPKGTDNPYIYILAESPGPEEDEAGIPLVGRSGKLLNKFMNPMGLNENNCRFFNVCRCMPKTFDEDGKVGFRAPSDVEISACSKYFLDDIENHKPKVILTLGATALKALMPDLSGGVSKLRGNLYDWNGIPLIPTFHPSYLLRNFKNENLRNTFSGDIKKAMLVASGEYVPAVLEDNASETTLCTSFKEFDSFCKRHIDDADTIAFDVETNAQELHSEKHRVVGFSIASSKDYGCYTPINSIDFKLPEVDKRLTEKRMRNILMNKRVIVYNCQHEWPVTLNWLDIEIPTVDDVFVMVKLMMGNAEQYQGNGGLKIQSVMNLGYNDWSEDVDKYFKYLADYEKNKDNMRDLLSHYYDEGNDLDNICKMVEDVALNILPTVYDGSGPISYEYIPYKLVGRYGSIDSSVLFELKKFYEDKMKEESEELGVDLFKGYEYWMDHHYAGYTLELNGAYWNDKKAQDIEDWCNSGMKESLSNLIASPLSEGYIKDSLYWDFISYMKDNHLDVIFGENYTPRRMSKNVITVDCNNEEAKDALRRMSLVETFSRSGKSTGWKIQLGNFETLCKSVLGQDGMDKYFDEFYTKYMDDYRSKDHTISEMKKLINPTATSPVWKDYISSILITDGIRMAKKYFDLVTITDDPQFDVDYYADFFNMAEERMCNEDKFDRNFIGMKFYKESHINVDYLPNDDTRLLSAVIKLNTSDISKKNRLAMFRKALSSCKRFRNRKINRILKSADEYKLETLDKGSMIMLFQFYEMNGIDIEDRSTWTERFTWLFDYQAYKKYAKMISTYIQGRVGRNSVYYVDKKSYENGDKISRRHDNYFSRSINDDESCVLQTDFKVNMADSGRWKATMHTMPGGTMIKGIVTSRFKGGIIAMPDCSQAEVRVLAAQSQDENLINAFQQEGMDIHKFVASLIYHHGDISKVTKLERKIAKSSVFGILYGESIKSFADENFHGDINEAQKVYDYFYTAFPKIKDYVEGSHRQYDKWGKAVLPITGRFIDYSKLAAAEMSSDKDRVYRQVQNGIIQGETVDLAGMILYNICKFVNDNNLKTKPYCFIHDSIELDIHPDEAFLMLDKLNPLFNDYPWKEFGVPMASDIVFSTNMGAEIECKELLHDEDYNDVTITMDGFEDDIDELIASWNEVYDVVEKDETFDSGENESVYVPMRGFFQEKVEINPRMGSTRYKTKVRYHVIRHAT